MKTLAILGAIGFALACDAPTAPRAPAKAFTKTSAAVLFNGRFETVGFVGNTCDGAVVEMNLRLHGLFALTVDGSGGFHLKNHEDLEGRGSDPLTGIGYVLNDASNFELNVVAGFEATFTEHVNVVAQGKAPNQVLQFDFHITVTPNGDITSYHNNFRFTCQGPGQNLRGKIAFHSDRSGDFDIFVMNADGTGVTQLTSNYYPEFDPIWSPDGKRIAFGRLVDGYFKVVVMNADGTGVTQLTNNAFVHDFPSAWSPDGKQIAFASNRTGPNEIFVMNADGSGVTQLTGNYDGENFATAWSPDGKQIALHSTRDGGDLDIFVMNADGSGVTQLTHNDVSDEGDHAGWSPDGKLFAFSSTSDGGDLDIFVMNADGTGVTQLTRNDFVADDDPFWSPDGKHIAFHSTRDGDEEIYVMNADGTGVTQLTFNYGFHDAVPAWTR